MGLAAFNRRRRELAAQAAKEAERQAEEKRKAAVQPTRRTRKDKGGDKDGDQPE